MLLLGISLLTMIILAGCGPKPQPSAQEEFQGESVPPAEPDPPKIEIRAKGFGDTELVISPSVDKTISGIVVLTMSQVPPGTKLVAFALEGNGIPSIKETGPNLGTDTDGSDGWIWLFDTTSYDNGLYDVSGIVFSDLSTGVPPLGAAKLQVIIKN